MYKCNTLKNKHLKDRATPIKWLLYRPQRNRVTSLRCKAIRMFFCQNVNLEQQEKIFGMLLDHLCPQEGNAIVI